MSTKAKLTLTETTILDAALARRNGHVLPLTDGADVNTPKVAKLLKSMLAAGLLEERRTTVAKNAWHTDTDGQHYLLRLTELGRTTAAGVSQTAEPAGSGTAEPGAAPAIAEARPPAGKLGQVLSAVQSSSGASIGDLIALTGWQPHTVRASLTRLRQTGVPIQLTGDDGQKRYTAAKTAEAAGA